MNTRIWLTFIYIEFTICTIKTWFIITDKGLLSWFSKQVSFVLTRFARTIQTWVVILVKESSFWKHFICSSWVNCDFSWKLLGNFITSTCMNDHNLTELSFKGQRTFVAKTAVLNALPIIVARQWFTGWILLCTVRVRKPIRANAEHFPSLQCCAFWPFSCFCAKRSFTACVLCNPSTNTNRPVILVTSIRTRTSLVSRPCWSVVTFSGRKSDVTSFCFVQCRFIQAMIRTRCSCWPSRPFWQNLVKWYQS